MEYRHTWPLGAPRDWQAPLGPPEGHAEPSGGPVLSARPSRQAREAERAAQEALRARFETRFADLLAGLIESIGHAAANGYDWARLPGAVRPARNAARQVQNVLVPAWEAVMPAFGDRLLGALNRPDPVLPGAPGKQALTPILWGRDEVLDRDRRLDLKDTADDFRRRAAAWIALNTPGRVAEISAGIEALILSAIEQGVRENATAGEIATAIRARTAGEIGRNRAARIARTEVHAAAVAAQDQAAEALDLGGRALEREWITAGEGARPSHRAADGQRRRPGEAFDVGGAKLMRPGNPAGPPGEVINCRCVLGYVPARPGRADG